MFEIVSEYPKNNFEILETANTIEEANNLALNYEVAFKGKFKIHVWEVLFCAL